LAPDVLALSAPVFVEDVLALLSDVVAEVFAELSVALGAGW